MFAYIDANRGEHSVALMCRTYKVSTSGFYAWKNRPVSRRARSNQRLLRKIERIHTQSGQTYGSPRVHRALKDRGVKCSRPRVARLMRRNAIRGRSADLYRRMPGLTRFFRGISNKRLNGKVTAPNQVWVSDLTYISVKGRYWYFAAVMDLFSRRIVGWAFGSSKDSQLTIRALRMAVSRRGPATGLIIHSDRGSEYAAYPMRKMIERLGFMQSMNRPRHSEDNNHMESFFHTFKADRIHGVTFESPRHLRATIVSYLPFYNRYRTHSSLDYKSPLRYEDLTRSHK